MLGNEGISANGTGCISLTRRGFTRNGVLTNGTTAGLWMNGMMAGVVLDGMKIVNKHVTSVSSFSLESSEWAKMNLDTRAAVNFGPEGIGDGSFYDWIPDGEAWQYQGHDENGLPRSLNGRLTDVQYCISICIRSCGDRVQQDFHVRHHGGYMIPTHSKIGQEMRIHFEKLLNEHGKNELIPVYLENDTPNFYLYREVKSEETHSMRDAEQVTSMAEQCVCKSNNNSELRCSTLW